MKRPYVIAIMIILLPYIVVLAGKLLRPRGEITIPQNPNTPPQHTVIEFLKVENSSATKFSDTGDVFSVVEIPINALSYFDSPGLKDGKVGKKSALAKSLRLDKAERLAINSIINKTRERLRELEIENASAYEDPDTNDISIVIEPFVADGELIQNDLLEQFSEVVGDVRGNLLLQAAAGNFNPMGRYSLRIPLSNSIDGAVYTEGTLFGEIKDEDTHITNLRFGARAIESRISPLIDSLIERGELN